MIKKLKNIIGCLLLAVTLLNVTANAQVVRTKYTVLDSFTKGFSALFGKSEEIIEFKLIELENLDTSEILRGVEMEIRTKDIELSSGSFALALSGSFWATRSSFTYNVNSKSGYYFLLKEDIKEIIAFFNLATFEIAKFDDKRYRVLKLSLNEVFEYGLIFNKEWSFYISAREAVYGLSYVDGLSISKKLNEYFAEIEKLSTVEISHNN